MSSFFLPMSDFGYAYESAARAYALNQNKNACKKYYALALEACNKIVNQEDKDLFLSDLKGGDWFGMPD